MKLLFPALITVALVVSACGKSDVKQSAGQIAAKVNGEEISLHRINYAIARGNESFPEQIKQTPALVLERIIDEEILVQSAVKARLDRDPQVMQAIEESKRQILARAYIERTVSQGSAESREEIEKFYSANPALFERRRVYHFQDLVVAAPREKLDALKAAASAVKSIDGVTEWLKSEKLPFQVEISSRPAEQIPLDILPELSQMREGQISVFPTPRGGSVVQLLKSAEAPLSKQQATPLIERFLLSRKRLEAARAEVKKLREQAKIEYVVEFDAPRPGARAQPASTSAGAYGGVNVDGQIEKGLAELR